MRERCFSVPKNVNCALSQQIRPMMPSLVFFLPEKRTGLHGKTQEKFQKKRWFSKTTRDQRQNSEKMRRFNPTAMVQVMQVFCVYSSFLVHPKATTSGWVRLIILAFLPNQCCMLAHMYVVIFDKLLLQLDEDGTKCQINYVFLIVCWDCSCTTQGCLNTWSPYSYWSLSKKGVHQVHNLLHVQKMISFCLWMTLRSRVSLTSSCSHLDHSQREEHQPPCTKKNCVLHYLKSIQHHSLSLKLHLRENFVFFQSRLTCHQNTSAQSAAAR